ncbi:hypothetical protein BSLG_009128 [Batrachochytrium salamandrivorans]|nr:hypothetical protein BSLG_009128 [Batrachochytrium salamandrivorans]
MSPSPDTAVDTIVTSVEPVKKSTKAPKASVLALAASLAGGAVPSSIIDASATPSHGESKPNPDTTSTLPVDHISNLNVDSDGEDTSSVYSKSTLFVSTLPFTATSDDLEEFFSQIGPVRSCFIAKQKATGLSSGCGYVNYALAEDAQKALVDLKKQKFMGGRTLKMKIALRKSVVVQRKSEGVPVNAEEIVDMEIQAKKDLLKMKRKLKVVNTSAANTLTASGGEGASSTAATSSTISHIPRINSLLLSNLPAGLTKKQLYKKVRKFGDVGDLQFPMDNSATADYQDCARVIYKDEESTRRAQKQLNEHKYKGATIKSVIDSAIKQPIPRARLIIRNLAFYCKPENLQSVFSAFGPIKECTVPHLPDGKARGFGFVEFEVMAHAEHALQSVNGTKILNRPVAVDWAIAKATYDRLAALPDAANDESESEEEMNDDEKDSKKSVSAGPLDETHESIVDNAMLAEDDEDGQEITMDDDDSDDDHSENEDDIEITMDDDDMDITMDDDDHTNSKRPSASGMGDSLHTKKQGAMPDVNDSDCTLFIRNLSFDTTEEELNTAFSTFGKLRYARVTLDKTSKLSRGTGFVCFYSEEDSKRCLAEYERAQSVASLMLDPTFSNSGVASGNADPKGKYAANSTASSSSTVHKSIITAELSQMASSGSSAFIIGGRMLNVTLAVSKKLAGELTHDSKLRRRSQDKRHMYLMREGVIFAGSEAAKTLSEAELLKRTTSFADRKRILATNPNLFISRTRLSVRSLMPHVTDHELRKTAKHAVISFWKQVEEGIREPLEPEVVEEEIQQGNEAPGIKRKVTIKQAKVLLDMDRLDTVTRKPKSKGYGFVEFNTHADALACLRWMNNNMDAFIRKKAVGTAVAEPPRPAKGKNGKGPKGGKGAKGAKEDLVADTKADKRPIVEFAVENRLIIKQRSQRNNMDASKQPRAVNQDESSISEPATGAAARVAKKDSKKRKREASDKANESKSGTFTKSNSTGDDHSLPANKKLETTAPKTLAKRQRTEHVTSKASRPPLGSADAATTEKPVSKRQAKRTRQTQDETTFASMVSRYRTQIGGSTSGSGDIKAITKSSIAKWSQ